MQFDTKELIRPMTRRNKRSVVTVCDANIASCRICSLNTPLPVCANDVNPHPPPAASHSVEYYYLHQKKVALFPRILKNALN